MQIDTSYFKMYVINYKAKHLWGSSNGKGLLCVLKVMTQFPINDKAMSI